MSDTADAFDLRGYVREAFGCLDPDTFRLCGMDEVGRGAFAGPLVAAAVVLPHGFAHDLLRDSKQLTAIQRERMDLVIRDVAVELEIVEIGIDAINRRGIGWANVEAFRKLVSRVPADGYCSDGNLHIHSRRPVRSLVKADQLVPAVSAASIVAKVHRDRLMCALGCRAPEYAWERNKGYGSRAHRLAIRAHGLHRQHRHAFVRNLMQTEMHLELEDGAAV